MSFDYGWDKFLSERDKQHDKLWGKTGLAGFGSKPALVLIDMYYSVVGFERLPIFESMKTWPGSMGLEGWAAVDQTVSLLAAARACGVPVIHVKGLETDIKPWSHGKRATPKLSPEMKRKGAQIVDEVKPIEGELVIEKAAASAFQGTPLAFHLNGLGVDTVICCGESTSGCVRASVVDGATHRYRMGVVAECVYDRTEASHFINLYDMHQKYADVVPKQMVIDYFHSITDTAADVPARKTA